MTNGINERNTTSIAKGVLDLGTAATVVGALTVPGIGTAAAYTAVGLMGARTVLESATGPEPTAAGKAQAFGKAAAQFAGGLGAASIAWSNSPIAMPTELGRGLSVLGGSLGAFEGIQELRNGSPDKVASTGRVITGGLSIAAGLTGSPTLALATVVAGVGTSAWGVRTEAKELFGVKPRAPRT